MENGARIMGESKRERLARIIEILDELVAAIGTQVKKKQQPDLTYVFDHYGDAREEIGLEMHALAIQHLEDNAPSVRPSGLSEPDSLLDQTRDLIQRRMKELYPRARKDLLHVPNYGWTQRVVLELLAQNVGRRVPSSRIRTLLNEQVHAERRMRELRELGYEILPYQHKGKSFYELVSLDPDIDDAARAIYERNRRRTKR